MDEAYEFFIAGRTRNKEKVLEICKYFDNLGIWYECSFKEQNPQETNKIPTRTLQEKRILEFCNEPKTLKEIVEYCGYKDIRNFRKQYINSLLAGRKIANDDSRKSESSKSEIC